MRALILALLLLVTPVLAEDSPPAAPADVARFAIEDFIRPSFAAFAENAATLELAHRDFCTTPTEPALVALRETFRDTVGGFARVSFLRFGPLVTENRIERLLLWPDPRGIALRQVQELLAEQPADALDVDALQQKSVALQGLSALEFVLFGTGADELTQVPDSYRCRYGAAVAQAIHRIAIALESEWSDPAGISQRLINPSAADVDYRSVREVLEELVGAAAHGVEAVRDTYLLPFLGRDGGKPKPRSAPLWRSNSTPLLAGEALRGIVSFLKAAHFDEASGTQAPSIAAAIAHGEDNVTRAEAAITGPVEEAVTDFPQLQGYRYLVVMTQSLQAVLAEQVAVALNLSVGFSALDGD